MGSAVHLDNLSHVTELVTNISAIDVTKPRTWEKTSCKPPSCQGHLQMSGKTITIPHRCEGGVLFVAWTDLLSSQSTHPGWCTQYSLHWRGERGAVFQCSKQRLQPRCCSLHVTVFMLSLPGQAHESTYNYGAKTRKRLHSSVTTYIKRRG